MGSSRRDFHYIDIDNDGHPVPCLRRNTPQHPVANKFIYLHALAAAGFFPSRYLPLKPSSRTSSRASSRSIRSEKKYRPNSLVRPPTPNYSFPYDDDPNLSPEEKEAKIKRRQIVQEHFLGRGHIGICSRYSRYKIVRETATHFHRMVETDPILPFHILWTDNYICLERAQTLLPFQVANYFPQTWHICRKDLLAQNLGYMYNLFPDEYDFFPKSWCLPEEMLKLIEYSNENKRKVYICKPEIGCQGRGINIIRNITHINPFANSICQLYVENPFLIDGLKFDLRIYVLLVSVDPLRFYVYKDGIARFATVKYATPRNTTNANNIFMHLTNYSINKRNSNYIYNNDEFGSKRKMSTIFKWFRERGYDTVKLSAEIDDVLVKTILSGFPFVKRAYNICFPDRPYACFQIFGFDIIINNELKPILLEVNHSSSLHTDEYVDEDVKRGLIEDTFSILNLHRLNKHGGPTMRYEDCHKDTIDSQFAYELKHMGGFRLLYPAANADSYDRFLFQRVYLETLKVFEFLPLTRRVQRIPTPDEEAEQNDEDQSLYKTKRKKAFELNCANNSSKLNTTVKKSKQNVKLEPDSEKSETKLVTPRPKCPRKPPINSKLTVLSTPIATSTKMDSETQTSNDPSETVTERAPTPTEHVRPKTPVRPVTPPGQQMMEQAGSKLRLIPDPPITNESQILLGVQTSQTQLVEEGRSSTTPTTPETQSNKQSLVISLESDGIEVTDAETQTGSEMAITSASKKYVRTKIRPEPIIEDEEIERQKSEMARYQLVHALGIPSKACQLVRLGPNYTADEMHYCERMSNYWKALHADGRYTLKLKTKPQVTSDSDPKL